MITIFQQQAIERWDTLPERLKDVMFSEHYAGALWQICEAEHLSENKIRIIADLVGVIILGFVLPEDLAKEISEATSLDIKISTVLTQEIDRKIFSQIRTELREIYNPVASSAGTDEFVEQKRNRGVIVLEKIGEEKARVEQKEIPERPIAAAPAPKPKTAKEGEPFDATQGKPLIIHEEQSLAEEKPMPSFKGLSLPFRIFKPRSTSEQNKPVRASIETFSSAPKKEEKAEKKIVHYSEFRTSLSPFEPKEEKIIKNEPKQAPPPETRIENPKTLQEKIQEIVAKTEKENTSKPNSGQPKLDGNVIDLR